MKIIVGNWKMNGTNAELDNMITDIDALDTESRVILCVPYTLLRAGSGAVMIGAQNISKYDSGAHTGEISGAMVRNIIYFKNIAELMLPFLLSDI